MTVFGFHLTASDLAAWWGACIATLALVWNILRWVGEGAKLRIDVAPNSIMVPATPGFEGTYVIVTASNVGTIATTITHFHGVAKPQSWIKRPLKRFHKHFIIPTDNRISVVPKLLNPGERWQGFVDQSYLASQLPGLVIEVGVSHNQSKKACLKRVRLPG